jgi:NDP-sugar pyrophosphorylase family protein
MDPNMKAVILAAGKGTRMGDLTKDIPKPMLQVDGKPVLEHIVEGLRDEAKIHDLFIIIGWQGQVIRDYFGDGRRWGVQITYGEQKVQDGTGKAPEVAREWVGGIWGGMGGGGNLSCWPAATSCCDLRPITRCWWRPSGKTA